jgi:CSLREA domain-containing protein
MEQSAIVPEKAALTMPALAMPASATITVNSTDDVVPVNGSDGKCTLREAITAANTDTALGGAAGECVAGSGDDTISFDATVFAAPGPHIISLTAALPDLTSNININGPRASLLTVSGGNITRVFTVNSGAVVKLSGLKMSNGKSSANGGGVYNEVSTLTIINSILSKNSADFGAGLYNAGGTVTIISSAVSDNSTIGGAGAGILSSNNGLSNPGTLTITNSTISNNLIGGGILFGSGILTITNSTISNNSTQSGGGGLRLTGASTMSIINTTITGNRADSFGGSGGLGGGIEKLAGTLTLNNSIVAGNFRGISTTPDDINGGSNVNSASFNLIGDASTSGGIAHGVNGNKVGNSGVGTINISTVLNPTLANNGGTTLTHALVLGSPALDQGSNALTPQDIADLDGDSDITEPVPFDQRGPGYARTADAADADTVQTVDIGAFEAHPTIEDITDKITNEDVGLTYTFNVGDKSLGIKSIIATSSNTALVADHNITCSPSGPSCSDTIVPASNQFGSTVITITITANNDATMSDSFNLTVNPVNDAPSAFDDSLSSVVEDSGTRTIPFSSLVANDSAGPANESGQTLTLKAVSSAIGGTVSISGSNVLFTPAPDYNGVGSFQYTIEDNGTSNVLPDPKTSAPATVSFNISAVNDAPVNNVPGAQTTNANTALTFSAANHISISDVDAGAALVSVTLTATNGTLSLSSTAGLGFTTGDGTADATMTFTGTVASINSALSGLVFTPTTGFRGTASLQITTNDQGNTGAGGALSDSDTVQITVIERVLQFDSATYNVGEASGHATITVTRPGSSAAPASVDYETSDLSGLTNCNVNTGNASARCDYTAVAGTLNFIAGQTSASFDVPLVNDVYVEGPETLTLTLSKPTGGTLGTPSTATLTITDNDFAPGAPNPIDTASFFVRQHYMDVLNREPEAQGLADWLAILNNCPAGDKSCDLIQVSSGFFRSPESFDRAYFIYRFYETALGRKPDYDEYQRDLRQVAGFLTDAELEARKAAFAEDFASRPEFKARYDSKANGDDYVNTIVATAGVVPSNRTSVAIRQGSLSITRGQALRELLESPEISARFFNRAFVVVGYFAYLRRDPDALYLVWIDRLDHPSAGQSYEDTYREMIGGFIGSQEYRSRFGLP